MTDPSASSRRELDSKVVARACANEAFRARLKADPHRAVADETGVTVPQSVSIEVLEETPERIYLVIPSDRAAIPDEDLEIAGGSGDLCQPQIV